jgi:hypothetical protein
LISFDGNENENWGASRNCVIQSDFNLSQKSRIVFPSFIIIFLLDIIFGHSQENDIQIRWSVSHFLWIFSIGADFLLHLFTKNRPFFHSKSKRWKLWGKIYWKLHFLVFPYFLFLQIFSEDIKKEEKFFCIFWGIFRLDGIFNHVFWEIFDL